MKKFLTAENAKLVDVSSAFSKYVAGKGYAGQLLVLATATSVKVEEGADEIEITAVVGQTVEIDLNMFLGEALEVTGASVGVLGDFSDISEVIGKEFKGYTGKLNDEKFYSK